MELTKLSSTFKKNWKTLAVGAAGAAVVLYVTHKLKPKTISEVLTRLSGDLVVTKKIEESAYNPEEKIFLRDPAVLEEKIYRLKAHGVDDLQILIDFDQTITCFNHGDKPCSSCFSMFRTSSFATPEYTAKAQANVMKYMPIEHDPLIPPEEKVKYLEEWWRSAEALVTGLDLDRAKLSQILEESHVSVRHGFGQCMKVCEHAQLPIYIVSGGVLDFMKPILAQFMDINHEGVKLFGNIMEFNSKGHFKAFAKPHINSLHKEVILSKQNTEAKFRKNAILIGDSINDRLMTKNLGLDTVIAVGFLDPKKQDHLEHYMEAFDIVILGDGNFTQIEALIREIVGVPQRSALKRLIRDSESPLLNLITLE